jgi:hypothetical protein
VENGVPLIEVCKRLPRIVDAPKELVAANPAHTGEAAPKHH